MSRFFELIKKFLSKNYWIQPVLLVAVIFGLVFSIQGITTLVENISSSLSGEGKCTTCKDISYKQLEAKLEDATDESPVIVLITTDDCAECEVVYKKLDVFVKNNPEYKVFRIEIQENEEETKVNKEVYDDETLTKAKLDALKMDIYEWLKEKDNTDLNTKPGEYDSFQIKTPTLVVFGSEQSGYENNQVIKVLENITTTSSSGKDTTIDTLRKFFTGVNIGDYKEPFPWWAWALCIGGGVGAIFAIFLVIKKNKKH